MLIFSVVIFVFNVNFVPRHPLPRKVGVMTPSSYGSAAPVRKIDTAGIHGGDD